MADYGLDPSIVNYVQGMPQSFGEYALPIGSVASSLVPQAQTPEPPVVTGAPGLPPLQPPPPPPPPPPPGKGGRSTLGPKGFAAEVDGPEEETPMSRPGAAPPISSPWLHPDVAASVQNQFGSIADPWGTGPAPQPNQVGALGSIADPWAATGHDAMPEPIAQPNVGAPMTRQNPDAFAAQINGKGPVTSTDRPQTAAEKAFNTSPEGIAESADAVNRGAIDKERAANADALAAETAQNDATNAALKAHGERQAKQAEIDQAKAAQDQANVEKYTQIYAQQIKDAADYKVDTNRDIGTRGLIAIALSGIGDALDHNHGPNAALQILDGAMDKRIADQWAQKKALGDKAAGAKDVLGVYRNNADDDRQAMQFQRAAESTRLADEIRQIGAQYANPAAKARAEALAAGLDQKSAGILQGEAARKAAAIREAQEEADRKAHLVLAQGQLGVAYGHLDLARQAQLDARTDSDRDFALKVAALEDKGDLKGAAALKAQQNDINERGVFAPTGTETVKNPDGTTALKPTFAPLMQQDGAPFLVPKDEHKEFAQAQGAVLQGLDAVDKLRRLRHLNGGQITNSEEALQATQEYARYILALHKAGGITRMSGEVIEKMEEIASGGRNPNSLRAIQSTLENSRKDLVDQYNINLRGQNYTGKRVEFPDQMKQVEPTLTENAQLRSKLQIPIPTVTDDKGAMRAVRVLEEQARSEDPKVSKTAIETLSKYSEEAPSEHIKQHAQKAFNRFVTGGKSSEPFFPDPEKHPGYYGDR